MPAICASASSLVQQRRGFEKALRSPGNLDVDPQPPEFGEERDEEEAQTYGHRIFANGIQRPPKRVDAALVFQVPEQRENARSQNEGCLRGGGAVAEINRTIGELGSKAMSSQVRGDKCAKPHVEDAAPEEQDSGRIVDVWRACLLKGGYDMHTRRHDHAGGQRNSIQTPRRCVDESRVKVFESNIDRDGDQKVSEAHEASEDGRGRRQVGRFGDRWKEER